MQVRGPSAGMAEDEDRLRVKFLTGDLAAVPQPIRDGHAGVDE